MTRGSAGNFGVLAREGDPGHEIVEILIPAAVPVFVPEMIRRLPTDVIEVVDVDRRNRKEHVRPMHDHVGLLVNWPPSTAELPFI